MPKALISTREHTLNPIEAAQLLKTCLDTLDYLVVRLARFAVLHISKVRHVLKVWIDGDMVQSYQ